MFCLLPMYSSFGISITMMLNLNLNGLVQISPVLQVQVLRPYVPRGTKKLDRLQAQTVKKLLKTLVQERS